MDVADLAPGQDFAQKIDQAIASCEAVLFIIGPKWMETLRQRLQGVQQDYVCHELESALAQHITIVPVLVGGASMAQLTGLPKKLEDLKRYQAAELRDSTFKEDCERLAKALNVRPGPKVPALRRKKLLWWIGAAAALLCLLFAVFTVAGVGPGSEYRARKEATRRLLATARTQTDQAEYEPAFNTYRDALKADPDNVAVRDLQVDAAMLWLRNFHVVTPKGQKTEDLAGPPLAEITSVLDAGLARTNGRGPRAADILAHLGWAHWLKEKFTYKEFGTAERGLRRALTVDPSNVFANAMLGNWLLQTDGSLEEALHCFDVALKTNQQRPLVREMQLGGMIYNDDPGVRQAAIRAVNQMRINGEPIEEYARSRILSSYDPTVNSYDELKETLSAVPPDEAWATFLWLDKNEANGRDARVKRVRREFIQAIIMEIAGKSGEALAAFRQLDPELKSLGLNGRIADHVAGAIKRLSR
jgi:tetratricopeptide (TPR) repeat protein